MPKCTLCDVRVLLLLLLGCNVAYAGLFDDEEARKQIASQQTLIGDLRNQGQALEARIAKLEETLKNQALVDLYTQVETLKLDLNKLRGQIEVLTNENELAQKRQKDFYIDLDSRLRWVEQPGISVAPPAPIAPIAPAPTVRLAPATVAPPSAIPPAPSIPAAASVTSGTSSTAGTSITIPATLPGIKAAAAPALPASPTPPMVSATPTEAEGRAYEAAYNLFKIGNYQGAIAGFQNFRKSHPASSLTPSAVYWIGNAHYALRDFKSAISVQQNLVSTYPDSAKVPDALLNIASSQQEMNDNAAARKTLEALIAKYPISDAAEKAKRRLANIK